MKLVVPGKLMVAGEYAVLEARAPALVVAVGPGLEAEVWPGAGPCLELAGLGLPPVAWRSEAGGLALGPGGEAPAFRFVQEGLATVQAWLGAPLPPFALRIGALPEGPDGRKLGLGGSAAATVAAVAAALAQSRFAGAWPPAELVFKLAAIAHLRVQGGGSGADVAASALGGWLHYTSFHPEWLLRRLASGQALAELVAEPWPFFHAEALSPLPQGLTVLAGFSGRSASTPQLLTAVRVQREQAPGAYQAFLDESRVAVEHLVAGLTSANPGRALAALKRNGEALARLGEALGVPILTPELGRLVALAEGAGAGAKSSGAGGGDSAIALAFDARSQAATEAAWSAAGFGWCALTPAEVGARALSLQPAESPPPKPKA